MSIPVEIDYATPDPSSVFTTPTDFVALLRLLTTALIATDLEVYVLSAAVPAVDDQNKIWVQLDGNGAPVGTYTFWDGHWVLIPPNPGNRMTFFHGDPTGLFDSTGLGLAGSGQVALPFFGWAIANGNNGTINMKDRMFIGANLDDLGFGWDSGIDDWQTTVTGSPSTVGGAPSITLDDTNTYRPATADVIVGGWQADGNTGATDAGLFGNNNAGTHPHTLVSADAGVTTPVPISIMNPYYAICVLFWVGYNP